MPPVDDDSQFPDLDAVVDESEDYDDDYIDPFISATPESITEEDAIRLLFEGSRTSVRSFVARLQYFKAQHMLSDSATGDLLELFRDALPRPNLCPGTLYQLAKITKEEFGSPRLDFERICSDCTSPLGDDNRCHQRGCNSFDLPQQASHGFGKIGLKWQIKRILDGAFRYSYSVLRSLAIMDNSSIDPRLKPYACDFSQVVGNCVLQFSTKRRSVYHRHH